MLILNALNWSYEVVSAPPARWSCSYLESGSTASALTPAETISQSAYTRAAIDVTLDGSAGRLMTGVIREHGIVEEEDSVIASASGLDLKADLLDFMPTAPDTYKGMQVLSDSNAPVPAGARKVLTIGSDSAGRDVKAAFGEDIVWETDWDGLWMGSLKDTVADAVGALLAYVTLVFRIIRHADPQSPKLEF